MQKTHKYLTDLILRDFNMGRFKSFVIFYDNGDWEYRYNNYRSPKFTIREVVFCVDMLRRSNYPGYSSENIAYNLRLLCLEVPVRPPFRRYRTGFDSQFTIPFYNTKGGY